MSIGIYKITNNINGTIYIGQSINIEARFRKHKNSNIQEIDKQIQLFGKDNFTFEIIEQCLPSELDQKEKYWVAYFDSYNKGYNQTRGGKGLSSSQKITLTQLEQIKQLLQNNQLTNIEIGKQFNVSENIISGINTGYYWYDEDLKYPIRTPNNCKKNNYCIDCGKEINLNSIRCKKCSAINRRNVIRPNKEELLNYLQEIKGNFTLAGQHFGVADNTIRKWCKIYDLPFHSSDYKDKKEKNIINQQQLPIKIGQYNKQNDLIAIYNSISEAERKTGILHIFEASDPKCTKRKTAGGFIWKRLL